VQETVDRGSRRGVERRRELGLASVCAYTPNLLVDKMALIFVFFLFFLGIFITLNSPFSEPMIFFYIYTV